MAISKNWSASRISTHHSCPLKYYYTYVKKWIPSKEVSKVDANKGLCFHETVEHYKTGMSHDDLKAIMAEKIKQYDVDTTVFDEYGALERFFLFWDELIATREKEGFIVKQEDWSKGEIEGEPFVGALDLFLENPTTNKCIIFDYKSAKTPAASNYKKQLVLYAYLTGLARHWSLETTVENIKLYVFFPFSPQEKMITMEDKMLSSVKQIKFTKEDMEDIIQHYYIDTIREIKNTDWENIDLDKLAVPQFVCKWCPFIGSLPNDKGFRGCKASYEAGNCQERGLTFSLDES